MKAAKAFFLVCAGILMLAVAAELLTPAAVAGEGESGRSETIVSLSCPNYDQGYAMSSTGRFWKYIDNEWHERSAVPLETATQSTSWSQLKEHFKE